MSYEMSAPLTSTIQTVIQHTAPSQGLGYIEVMDWYS